MVPTRMCRHSGRAGLSPVQQDDRYHQQESEAPPPLARPASFDVLRNLALALNTSADSLLFDEDERGPSDDLTLHLEAINHLDPDDQDLIRSIIEAILLRHDTRRWTNAS